MAENPPSDRGALRYHGEQVDEIVVNGAIFDQANGALMHIYEVDAAKAFDMLRSRAPDSRVSVRQLAELILIHPRLAQNLWD